MSEDFYYEDEQPQQMDPRLEGMLNAYEQAQAENTYEQEMTRVITMNPHIDPEELHVFVSAADGNFDDAVLMHQKYNSQFQTGAPADAGYASAEEAPSHADPTATPTSLGEVVRDFAKQFAR